MSAPDRSPTALPPMPRARALAILERARPPAGAAPVALVRLAARLCVPLAVIGPSPTARRRLARAIHAAADRQGALVAGPWASPPCDDAPATVLVDVSTPMPGCDLLIESLADDRSAWLLIGAATLDDLSPDVVARVGDVHLEVPALGSDEVASTARDVLRTLTEHLGQPPALDDAGALALATGLEAPDRPALEALLARALVLRGAGASLSTAPAPASNGEAEPVDLPLPEPDVADDATTAARLEYVLAELAHELRNPLVTLKTVADHLDDLAEDAELRSRFAALAGEAVGRMDGLLDNLITYGRLGAPSPKALELTGPLNAALQEAAPALAGRRLRVRADAGDAVALVDPEHLAFALKNLLYGIAQTATPDGDVAIDATVNGVVRLRFAADADAGTLQRVVAPQGPDALFDPSCQPLPFSLARAVLHQTGGSVAMAYGSDGRTAIEVHVPVPGSLGLA